MKKKKDYTIEPILSLASESTITCQYNPILSILPLLIYSGVAAYHKQMEEQKVLNGHLGIMKQNIILSEKQRKKKKKSISFTFELLNRV